MYIRYQQIYAIVNEANGKTYIGRSSNPKQRFIAHKTVPPNERFSRDYKKFGKENFKLIIIEDFMPESVAKLHEEFWILYKKTYLKDKGYNIRIGDKSGRTINDEYITWLWKEVHK